MHLPCFKLLDFTALTFLYGDGTIGIHAIPYNVRWDTKYEYICMPRHSDTARDARVAPTGGT